MGNIRNKLKSNIKTILTTIIATSLFNFSILTYKHHKDNELLFNSRQNYFEILRYYNASMDFNNRLLEYMNDNNLEETKLNGRVFSKNNLIWAINDNELHIKSDSEKIKNIANIYDKTSFINYLRINERGLQIEADNAKYKLKEVLTDNFKLGEKTDFKY